MMLSRKIPGDPGGKAQELRVLSGEGNRTKGLDGPMEIDMKFFRQEMVEGPRQPHLQDGLVLLVGEVTPLNHEGDVVSQTEPLRQDDPLLLPQHQLFSHLRRGLDHGLMDQFRLGSNAHPDHIVREAGDVLEGIFHRVESDRAMTKEPTPFFF